MIPYYAILCKQMKIYTKDTIFYIDIRPPLTRRTVPVLNSYVMISVPLTRRTVPVLKSCLVLRFIVILIHKPVKGGGSVKDWINWYIVGATPFFHGYLY